MPLSVRDLPDDILCIIFAIVIYEDDPQEESDLEADRSVLLIYRRLFTLIGVCLNWRAVCLSTGLFWSIIPSSASVPPNFSESVIELCAGRAGNSDLHVTTVGPPPDTGPNPIFRVIEQYGSRIRTIDISGYHHHMTLDLISHLLNHTTPGHLDNLSIRTFPGDRYRNTYDAGIWLLPTSSEYLSFNKIAESLRTLRLRDFKLDWGNMRFFGLVELRLEAVAITGEAMMNNLIHAIASAPKLQNLQLVQMILYKTISEGQPSKLPSIIVSLQGLRSLFLQNVNSGILMFLLRAIAPGSYRIAVSFAGSSMTVSRFSSILVGWLRVKTLDLRSFNVDTLILSGSQFYNLRFHAVLQRLLHAMPTIKSLCIRDCPMDEEALQTLIRPLAAATGPEDIDFPIIRRLHIVDTEFHINALDKLKEIVTRHSIQELRLGRILGRTGSVSLEASQWACFENPEDDPHAGPIRDWLQANVPDFAVVRRLNEVPGTEFRMQLW